jgi:hypothetical protein
MDAMAMEFVKELFVYVIRIGRELIAALKNAQKRV